MNEQLYTKMVSFIDVKGQAQHNHTHTDGENFLQQMVHQLGQLTNVQEIMYEKTPHLEV